MYFADFADLLVVRARFMPRVIRTDEVLWIRSRFTAVARSFLVTSRVPTLSAILRFPLVPPWRHDTPPARQ
jgi:hypothetical protein